MQPHRRGTRAAIEAEGERALARVADIILGIRDVEDAGLGRAVFELQEDRAGCRRVLDLLPTDLQGMLGLNNFFFRNGRFLFFFRLFRWFFRLRRLLLLSKTQIPSAATTASARKTNRKTARKKETPPSRRKNLKELIGDT